MFALRVTYLGFDAQVDQRLTAIVGKVPDDSRYEYLVGRRTLYWHFTSITYAQMGETRLTAVWHVVNRRHGDSAKRAWRTMRVEIEDDADPITRP